MFLVINKIDLVLRAKLLPLIERFSALYPFAEVIPISASKKDGLDTLLMKLVEYLPQGSDTFPRISSPISPSASWSLSSSASGYCWRPGKRFPMLRRWWWSALKSRSLPQANHPKLPLTRISAVIYCERSGQKAILIGKGGSKLKSIGAAARKEIESLLGTRVYLELHVIVEENWRESRYFVDSLDWRKQLEDLANAKPAAEERAGESTKARKKNRTGGPGSAQLTSLSRVRRPRNQGVGSHSAFIARSWR